MENDRCSKMGMQAFLLAPMQRITRYPLLLSKLLSHTAVRHPDKGALQQCMDQLANLLDEINVVRMPRLWLPKDKKSDVLFV